MDSQNYKFKATFKLGGINLDNDWLKDGFSFKKSKDDISEGEYVFELPVSSPEQGTDFVKIAEKKTRRFIEVLSLYYMGGDHKSPMLKVNDFKVVCMNAREVKPKGSHPIFSTFSVKGSFLCSGKTLDEVLANYYIYEKLKDKRWHLIVDYMRTGMTRDDVYARFIDYWISFNALYNLKSNKRREHERISDTLQNIFDTEKICKSWIEKFSIPLADNQLSINFLLILSRHRGKTPIEILINLDLKDKSGRHNHSKMLGNAVKNKNYCEALVQIAQCLYILRCNLFHGSILHERDKDIYLLGAYILESLMQPMIHYELNELGLS